MMATLVGMRAHRLSARLRRATYLRRGALTHVSPINGYDAAPGHPTVNLRGMPGSSTVAINCRQLHVIIFHQPDAAAIHLDRGAALERRGLLDFDTVVEFAGRNPHGKAGTLV